MREAILRCAAIVLAGSMWGTGFSIAPCFAGDPLMSEPLPSTSSLSWMDQAGVGGHMRTDYYSASKKLDNTHSLPGLTLQPKAQPTFGTWGDAKIEGRLMDENLRGEGNAQGRLLEAYANLYLGAVDIRVGKQNISWGRADTLNPTDNLTPQDFTLLSALDQQERRTGSTAVKATYTRDNHALSLVWIPIFNPTTIPFASPPGIRIIEDKRSSGAWTDQGFAAKWERTGGDLDWSLSYYYGLDLFPVGRPVSPTNVSLIHTRIRAFGVDFATTMGRYGIKGEGAFVQTQNPSGTDPYIKKPYLYYVLGVDRDLTEDLSITLQAYQRIVVNWRNPFQIPDPQVQAISALNATVNYQLDQYSEGLSGRMRSTWLHKTLEAELIGQWNANRGDFVLRPSMAYAFTDVWKGYAGYDIFNGRAHSFFGRLEPTTAFFAEVRRTF